MNQQEVSFRSDEQAQSQDRERLQSEIQEAWNNILDDHLGQKYRGGHTYATDSHIKLLKWALGVK